MRHNYFYAVKIPEVEKNQLHRFVAEKKHNYPFKNWVHPQDYHITLAFLGKIDEELLREANNNVQNHLFQEKSFSLTIRRLGIFGSKHSPRVFWADVYPSSELLAIRQSVYQACEQAGLVLDQRPFRPHITLARRWTGDGPFTDQLKRQVQLQNGTKISFSVEEIVLYESWPQAIPRYKEVANFPLFMN